MTELGVRTWGNAADGATMLLTGTYHERGEVSRRLLGALPPLLVVCGRLWDSPFVPLLAAEIVKDDPGQEAVLDRLLDLLLIAVLRELVRRRRRRHRPGSRPTAIRSSGGRCGCCTTTRRMPWTVASLAARVGVSRAALARRFTALVGEPPMPTWRSGGSPSRRTCCREPGARSARSRTGSAMAARSRQHRVQAASRREPDGTPRRPTPRVTRGWPWTGLASSVTGS